MSNIKGTIEMVKQVAEQGFKDIVVYTETGFVLLSGVRELLPEIDFNAVAELYQAELDAE